MLEVREARISNFKGQLVFKMTKDAEPTMEKCVVCGRGADVILEKKFMVRICHGCQEVTAATSDTQPPAVPGSGAAGGGSALEVPGSGAAGGGAAVIASSRVKKRISKRSRTNKPVEKGHSTGVVVSASSNCIGFALTAFPAAISRPVDSIDRWNLRSAKLNSVITLLAGNRTN